MKKLILLLTLTMMFGQTEWTTRLYSGVEVTPSSNYLDFDSIAGFNIGNGRVTIINIYNDLPQYTCTINLEKVTSDGNELPYSGIDILGDGFWHSHRPDFALIDEFEYY